MSKKVMCDCWIGWFEEIDHSEWFTVKDLFQHIQKEKEYAEHLKTKYGEDRKVFSLSDYCDKRKSTDLTRFNYCPLCGKKIDWKAIKGGANG